MHYDDIIIEPRTFAFKRPAGTSRGVYTSRKSWYVSLLRDGKCVGMGECAPLPKLSCDDLPDYERILRKFCDELSATGKLDYEALRPYPSMLFGLETTLKDAESEHRFVLFDTPFTRGSEPIVINGLIWMGSFEYMREQIEDKLAKGFGCVKLKIGAIDFEKEMELLKMIRSRYSTDILELRVDANGAFSPEEAFGKLERLAKLGIHSIEQPIKAGNILQMAKLTRTSPLPIALDEEMIGINYPKQKRTLLEVIRPQYIVLKPSLHGGMVGTAEWISEAERLGIGWWITSALESNIGLNAIAQFCSTYNNHMPQGLGTGQLYADNFDLPFLRLKGDKMWFERK